MSAESLRQVNKKENPGHVVLPQTINDPSLIDSVAGFIQEVVPQAYSTSTGDSREQITWVRVQQADINDPALYPDTGDQDGVPPLLLVLGYGTGVQVWSVPASGEAREVLSWSQGSVRTLCVLPNPESRLPLRQDLYKHKRPLVAIVDNAGPGPQFCSVNFISLREGDQVKSIKFSQQVWDVVANKRSVVITLAERIAVFDASSLEDNLAITTCYPSPDVNPVALGSRWLAYADRRLVTQWRSLGGCLSEGPHSVTATVFHAAKFLGKGLRDLGETVASSLTGSSPDNSYSQSHAHAAEPSLKGIVTILDIETKLPKDANEDEHQSGTNRFVAHFNAHFEPIVALNFDPSGMLLVSADKRGHRFHVFRINPHPCGPTLAYVQHLYTLHRGDTSARVQDIAFSADSRWVAVSSMRGTTHVFPITPYGGPVGMRTHTTPHVVNKLSRFHRSAGLTDDGRNSPVLWDGGGGSTPPPSPAHPQPTTVTPLAQVRRQTIAPLTEDSVLRVAACFGAPRAVPLGHSPHLPSRTRRSVDSLYVIASNGSLIQYDLEPKHLSGVTKEKVCDETGVELHVEVKAEWVLQRPPYSSSLHPPLSCTNPLLCQPDPPLPSAYDSQPDDERWLSQVEIVTHVGPHRRLWMGPQFTFITVNSNNDGGEALDVSKQVVRSNPVNMPLKQPLIIESGSCSSLELSPNMVELVYKTDCSWSCRLREDLAEAMQEAPSPCTQGDKGVSRREPVIERQVNPLGSVVTLTAQLNFPAELLAPADQVTVVGTEVKKITLESRLNKPVLKNILSGCLFGDHVFDPSLRPQPVKTRDFESPDFLRTKDKTGSESEEHEGKNQVKVLMEVNENIVKSSEEKQPSGEVVIEKKGKISKSKRKLSKGEKNRLKVDIVAKPVEEEPYVPESKPDQVEPLETEVDGRLQCSGDIEMQLREASAEKDFEDVLIEEDNKGRKRSLDITIDMKNSIVEDCKSVQTEKYDSKETKENEKANSRQRKKSRTNDKDRLQTHTLASDKADSKNLNKLNSANSTNSPEKVMKIDDKSKGKKRRPKKSVGMNESVCLEVQCSEPDFEDKKLFVPENQIDTQMNQEFSASDSPPPSNTGSFEEPIVFEQIISDEIETSNPNVLLDDPVSDEAFNISIEEPILVDEKSLTTDDELKGLESDLLVKDSSWSPEVSFEKEVDVIMDDKESDKEADKAKNYETTDKDSSDDCQPVVVKSDFKQSQKKGKNRKISRKSREPEPKVQDEEMKLVENVEKNESSPLEAKSLDPERGDKIVQEETGDQKYIKNDSEDEEFMDAEKVPKEGKTGNEAVTDLKFIDGVKRRFRKKASLDEDLGSRVQLIEPVVPKRSWSSVVAINCEDPNGNILKPEEPILPVRSWSSIAAGGAKSKLEGESAKTNSVEDRDSVYESCNDSVGEEVEPTCDSLGSCYFETESKEETEEAEVEAHANQEEQGPSESKSVSTSEDKSNTDSGEKDEISAVAQAATKKSKKQKKKKR